MRTGRQNSSESRIGGGSIAGFDQHILDPWLNPKIVENFDRLGQYDDIQKGLTVNTDLEKLGQNEIKNIGQGNYGSTMLAGVARQQGARDIAGYKASHRLGSAAMARMPGNASSAGVNVLYDRMLQQQLDKVNARTSDEIVGGMPSYINNAAQWAEAGNNDRMRQMQGLNNYQAAFSNAVKLRQSNETFTKQKSFWDKLKEGISFASNILHGFNLGGGGGSSNSGGSGSGGGPGGWSDPDQEAFFLG